MRVINAKNKQPKRNRMFYETAELLQHNKVIQVKTFLIMFLSIFAWFITSGVFEIFFFVVFLASLVYLFHKQNQAARCLGIMEGINEGVRETVENARRNGNPKENEKSVGK